jgi:hypothetical protein
MAGVTSSVRDVLLLYEGSLPGLFVRGSAAELVQTHLSLPQGTFGGDDGARELTS